MSTVKLIPQSLLNEIERERHRQEEKFPGQVLSATSIQRLGEGHWFDNNEGAATEEAGVASELMAKSLCNDCPDWSRVLVEEVSEAISAAGRGDAEHAKEELVQVAAVAIRWIQAIDRGEVGF